MDKLRFQAFLDEFPFLERVLDFRGVDCFDYRKIRSINIKRIDKDFLNRTPVSYSSEGGIEHWEKLFSVLLQRDSSLLVSEVEIYPKNDSKGEEGERIVSSLEGYKQSSHLVWLIRYVHPVGDVDSFSVTIYKPRQDSSLALEIVKAKEAELKTIQAEADF